MTEYHMGEFCSFHETCIWFLCAQGLLWETIFYIPSQFCKTTTKQLIQQIQNDQCKMQSGQNMDLQYFKRECNSITREFALAFKASVSPLLFSIYRHFCLVHPGGRCCSAPPLRQSSLEGVPYLLLLYLVHPCICKWKHLFILVR